MRRISPNTAFGVLLVAFTTLGAAHAIREYQAGKTLKVKLNAAISHPILLGGTQQTAFIKIDLTGFKIDDEKERTPVNLALVLDKSGSMNGQKMEQAIEATLLAIDRLSPGDVVSVIAYDNQAHVLLPATEVVDKHAIKERVRYLGAGGGTALFAGVTQGAWELRKFLDPSRVNRVVLLSDGQANQGPSSPSELGDLGAALIEDGISVTTIGLGLGYNEDLMTQLALRSDGNHSFVENVENLAMIFDQEFGDVLSVVAQDVAVSIDLHEGVRPVRVLGRESQIDGQTVTIKLNQLYSEQEKYVMLEVETDPSLAGDEIDIARVSASYANMATNEDDDLFAVVSARFTDSEEIVQENIDEKPMVAAVEQQGIVNEERAIQLRDEGRIAEAEEVLRENAAFYQQNAERYGDDRLLDAAEGSRAAAGNLEPEDWNRQRKAMRSDHYRGKTQQQSGN